jgi:hypothetical protein
VKHHHHDENELWAQSLGREYIWNDERKTLMVLSERDIWVEGMPATVSALEQDERHKHLRIMDEMKRRLSVKGKVIN